MKAFIRSYGIISPQKSIHDSFRDGSVNSFMTALLQADEPSYKDYINPLQLRRMPRILKMALATSKICMDAVHNPAIDAIIVGTGLGSLDNLENFMFDVEDNLETALSPTSFMQSTHNQVASQIALLLKNHNYNMTYCHRGFSFEWALLDALMLLEEKEAENILIGGIDVNTVNVHKVHSHNNYWKSQPDSTRLLRSESSGTLQGEGAAFFMLSSHANQLGTVELKDVHTFYKPKSIAAVKDEINVFLVKNGLSVSDVGIAVLGISGDLENDVVFYDLMDGFFDEKKTRFTYYKHLCGEYYTSSAFAFWMAVNMLENQFVPQWASIGKSSEFENGNILIYNHYQNNNHSLILLKR